tara:strand:+ start:43 stop:2973 length:2931 start_codon:yes stop_codon:yes gene_type:complete
MADNLIDPDELARLTEIFRGTPIPDGIPSQEALEKESQGLASFLGTPDYAQESARDRSNAKLQAYLALAKAGFDFAGAQPRVGESPMSVFGRAFGAPLAEEMGGIAETFSERARQRKALQRSEERGLKISALERVEEAARRRKGEETAAHQTALQFLIKNQEKNAEVLETFMVDGVNIPVVQYTDYNGNLTFTTLDGKKIDASQLTIAASGEHKDKVTAVSGIEKIVGVDENGKPIYVPINAQEITPFDENGNALQPELINTDDGGILLLTGKDANARKAPPAGSTTSNYHSPGSATIYLNRTFLKAFQLPEEMLHDKATLYTAHPKRGLPGTENLSPIQSVSVGGQTYQLDEHTGYNQATGNIELKVGSKKTEVLEASSLFSLDDPLEFTRAGELTVGTNNLAAIRKIPGFGRAVPGESVTVERNRQGETRVIYKNISVKLTPDQASLFQAMALSERAKVETGQTLGKLQSVVNTSNKVITLGKVEVGPGQVWMGLEIELDKALRNDPSLANSIGESSAVSSDTKSYMLTGVLPEDAAGHLPFKNTADYAAGDAIWLNAAQFNNLPSNIKNLLSDDAETNKKVTKRKGLKTLWEQVIKNNDQLKRRAPTEEEIEALLTMFPSGMRSGGSELRNEIFKMIKFGMPREQRISAKTIETGNRQDQFKEATRQELKKAQARYEGYVAKGALAERPWDSLSFVEKRAFADMASAQPLENVAEKWNYEIDRITADQARYEALTPDDITAYRQVIRLLLLSKELKETNTIDKSTGKFFGWLSEARANLFADITPVTDLDSQRLQQIINEMKASYGTLAGTEGIGKPSNLRLSLQQGLLPAFRQPAALNARNLDTMIARLESTVKSVFSPSILAGTVIPASFETMAHEAGVKDIGKINPRRYRWLDPNVKDPSPLTRANVLESLGKVKFVLEDVKNLTPGRRLPPDSEGRIYIKIRNTDDGRVVIQEPYRNAPLIFLDESFFE